jgi:uncharacterized membrane protein
MKQRSCLLAPIIVFLMLFLSITPVVHSDGYGVVPASIVIDNLLKGSSNPRSIRIINSGDEPVTYKLNATGSIASWVTFYPNQSLITPVTTVSVLQRQEVFVLFTIPEDVANGDYTGTINVETLPTNASENMTGSPVILSFPVNVLLTVTGTQILTGDIRDITTKNVEVGQPLSIFIDFTNTGNVIATPHIKVNITRENYPIAQINYKETSIPVEKGDIIEVTWNTSNRESGNYDANVTVMLEDEIIAQTTLNFNLLPRGTLTRKGELLNLSYTGQPTPGSTIKILALFKNTGKIETNAKFMAEVYRDGSIVDVIESEEEPTVKIQETYQFTSLLTLKEAGRYEIQAYVFLETNKTAIRTLTIDVSHPLLSNLPLILGVIGIVVGGGLLYVFLLRKQVKPKTKKRRKTTRKVLRVRRKKTTRPRVKDVPWYQRLPLQAKTSEDLTTSKMVMGPALGTTARRNALLELTSLRGIGRSRAHQLIEAGIDSLDKLRDHPDENLMQLDGFTEDLVKSLRDQLQEKD